MKLTDTCPLPAVVDVTVGVPGRTALTVNVWDTVVAAW